jgi:hypothetical protein
MAPVVEPAAHFGPALEESPPSYAAFDLDGDLGLAPVSRRPPVTQPPVGELTSALASFLLHHDLHLNASSSRH